MLSFNEISAHANQNGSSVEKVWLEIRSNEQQMKINEATDSMQETTNSAVSQGSSLHSFNIDARVPVNV